MQTQTSSALHIAIMEADGKDRPSMLAPGNYVQLKSRTKGYIDTKPNHELIHFCLKNPPYQYKFLTTDANATSVTPGNEANACPNAIKMWKVIKRLKQGESINVQDLETNMYWEFRKFTSQEGESLKSTRNVANDDASSKEKEIDKLTTLILMSFNKIYKPTNNNLITSSNTKNLNVDHTLRLTREIGYDRQTGQYDNQRETDVVRARENVGTQVVQQTGIQCYNCMEFGHLAMECHKQEQARDLAYHKEKMLMCEQEERQHPEQPESVNETYLMEQGDTNITHNSSDLSNNEEAAGQDDQMLQKERELLASLIDQIRIEIDANKQNNKALESSNTTLREINTFLHSELTSPQIKTVIEQKLHQITKRLSTAGSGFYNALKQEMVEDLKYFKSFKNEVESLQSQIETQKTQFFNEINRLSREMLYLLVEIILFIVESGCSKHMTGNLKLLPWLWHHRLSHLNFDTINLILKNDIVIGLPKLKFIKDHLCSSCELGKAKQKSFKTKTTSSSKRRLQLLHIDLCIPIRVESINGKKYVLVIVGDYSRYTWTHFLMSKDETPKVLIDFLKLIQRGLHAQFKPRTTMYTEVPNANMIVMTSMIELESLFSPLFDEYIYGENQVVSKSFAVTTADASDKCQQQPDSTSFTSTLATTVTTDGNFDLSCHEGICGSCEMNIDGCNNLACLTQITEEKERVNIFEVENSFVALGTYSFQEDAPYAAPEWFRYQANTKFNGIGGVRIKSLHEVNAAKAVEKRFGGNAITKKTQKNLLKQQYENFTASSSEVLDQTLDRLQKLISQLEIHGESISQEDVNKKFLRKAKGTSSSNTNTQNVAFVSSNSTNNTNGAVNTGHDVTTASTQATAVNSTTIDNLSDAVICSFFASQPNSPQLDNEDLQQIHTDDLEEMDLKWQMAIGNGYVKSGQNQSKTDKTGHGNERVQEIKAEGKFISNLIMLIH
nr:retrovirus-related Pol polyprotein from transposon TNT 1-94 [Tanacetum cinerariifolium]